MRPLIRLVCFVPRMTSTPRRNSPSMCTRKQLSTDNTNSPQLPACMRESQCPSRQYLSGHTCPDSLSLFPSFTRLGSRAMRGALWGHGVLLSSFPPRRKEHPTLKETYGALESLFLSSCGGWASGGVLVLKQFEGIRFVVSPANRFPQNLNVSDAFSQMGSHTATTPKVLDTALLPQTQTLPVAATSLCNFLSK